LIVNLEQELIKKSAKKLESDEIIEDIQEARKGEKVHVVEQLEKQAKDGYEAKKAIAHPLPPEMYKKLTKFLDKYGEDFEVSQNALTSHHIHFILLDF